MKLYEDHTRTISALIGGMIFALWIFINYSQKAASIFLVLIFSSILIYYISKSMGAKAPIQGTAGVVKGVLYGIDKNWKVDIFHGLLAGFAFLFFMRITSLTVGYPLTIFEFVDEASRVIVNSILAPIGEEAAFAIILWYIIKKSNSISVGIIITAVIFAAFHYTAYGAHIPNAYVGAAMFRLAMIGLIMYTKSILPAMIAHSMINSYLYIEEQQLFSLGA